MLNQNYPILAQCSIYIPPENVRRYGNGKYNTIGKYNRKSMSKNNCFLGYNFGIEEFENEEFSVIISSYFISLFVCLSCKYVTLIFTFL